jgi:hypothetical protein
MFQSMQVKVKGIAPLVMHNGRLADPFDPFTRELKRITSKRKKTDEDLMAASSVEWCGGLYHTEGDIEIGDGVVLWGKNIKPIVPASLLKACIVEGAKKAKLGKQAKAGVIVDEDCELEYTGPKDMNKLMSEPRFALRKQARVQQNRVMRTRPIFREWALAFGVEYDPEVMNVEQVLEALIQAGRYVGLGDWRPEFGRFEVVRN